MTTPSNSPTSGSGGASRPIHCSRRIGANGLALIRHFEGLRLSAYQDIVGIWTIGYGHTRGVYQGMRLSGQAEADRLLLEDIDGSEKLADLAIVAAVTQNQFDAFVSILFNVGPGIAGRRDGIITLRDGRPSTLIRHLNAQLYGDAADDFLSWDRAGGDEVAGLLDRRRAERTLFLTPDDQPFTLARAAA